ncbi:MAG: WD40 repeat domain-containing protein [Deltaproteobacteria bacterium]|nr:WD40 repeat domain-containing protein [Deltaproteobacteria bacterium]
MHISPYRFVPGLLLGGLLFLAPTVAWASNQGGVGALLFLLLIFGTPVVLGGLAFILTIVLTVVEPSEAPRRSVRVASVAVLISCGLVLLASVAGPMLTGGFSGGAWMTLPPVMAVTGIIIAFPHLSGRLVGRPWLVLRIAAWGLPLLVVAGILLSGLVGVATDSARDENLQQRIDCHSYGTHAVSYLEDGERIFAAGHGWDKDRHLQRYSKQQGKWQREDPWLELERQVESATVDAAHKRALVATGNEVWLIDLEQADRSRLLPKSSGVFSSVALGDGARLGSAGGNGEVRVWSLDDGLQIHQFKPLEKAIDALIFGRDAKTIIAAGGDRKLVVIDLKSGETPCVIENVNANVFFLDVDGKTLLTGSYGPEIRRWDLEKCAADGLFATHASTATAFALSPDGTQLAVGDSLSRIFLYPYPGGGNTERTRVGTVSIKEDSYGIGMNAVTSISFGPGGQEILASSKGCGTMAVFRSPPRRPDEP